MLSLFQRKRAAPTAGTLTPPPPEAPKGLMRPESAAIAAGDAAPTEAVGAHLAVTPESQAAQAEAWTAGTAYAALLHDIGKIAVDLHVEYADGMAWHPWHGPLRRPLADDNCLDRSTTTIVSG